MYHFATYKTVTIFYVLKILNAFTVYKIIEIQLLKRIWHRTCIKVIVIKNLFKTSKGEINNETTNKQRT